MKITGFKRVIKEDFPQDEQPLIDRLSNALNSYLEQLYYAFNNNISIRENLLAQTVQLRLKVDANGKPDNNQLNYTLKTRPLGITVMAVYNMTDTTPLSGAPFVVFSISGSVINISQITGLVPGKAYELTLVIYGN